VTGRAVELYVAAFLARFGGSNGARVRGAGISGFATSHGEPTVRLVVTDDRAYDQLTRDVPSARHGSVSVFETAPRCAELMRDQAGWKPDRPSTSMVHGEIDDLPDTPLPTGLVVRPVNRQGPELAEAAAVAIASDTGITEPAAEFEQFLKGLSSSTRLFVAVDEDGVPRATSGCEVFGEFARIFFVNTEPSWRGRGIGGAMTLAALRAAARAGARLATLEATDAGASLYRRLGFESAGRMTRYFPR
jgi:ribosomal protein S18 acetylase RimI-like enzyme